MGKGKAPASQEITQTKIPSYARPYFERLMSDAESITGREYSPYGGQRIASQSPDTLAAYDMTRGMVGQGIGGVNEAMGVSRDNIAMGQQLADTAAPFQFGASGFSAAPTDAAQFAQTQMFTPEAAQQYMSPYIQNVLDRQMTEAQRQFGITQASRDARSVGAGAFGGSRQAVEQSLNNEALMRQLGDIYGTGMQGAYRDAQGAFQADRGAAFAREQAQVGELARAQGLGASELGRVQEGTAAEAARVQAAQSGEDARARQEQLQMMGFTAEQAMQLAGLGERDRAAAIQDAQMLEAIGRVQEGREREGLDLAYQDFIRQEAFPEQQLQLMSSILQGVPIQNETVTTAYAPSNPAREALGTGLQAIGTYKGLQG